nr:stress response protein NST1-like [Quercus suber]
MIEPTDPKRRRDLKDKEVVEAERSRSTLEDEAQRAAKQQKVSHGPQRVAGRTTTQSSEPEAWLPAPMLGGEPLREDASLRDLNSGIGCHIASVLEETLLLPKDMTEMRGIRKNEVFPNAKRYLGIQLDDERKMRATAVQTLTIAEQSNVQLKKKLAVEEQARKSAKSALENTRRQAEDQRKHLRDTTDQMATSQEQISNLKKQLEEAQRLRDQAEKAKAEAETAKAEAEKEKDKVEQEGYDIGVAETEDKFRTEVPAVCRVYCAQTWTEALNRAGVDPSSELRRPKNVYFPPAILALSPSSQPQDASSTAADSAKEIQIQNPPPLNQQEQPKVPKVAKDISSDKAVERPKDEVASQSFEQALASITLPAGGVQKEKEKGVPPEATDIRNVILGLPISLWIDRSGISVLYPQIGTILSESFAIKLKTIIRDERLRNPESSNDIFPDTPLDIHIPDIG